MPTPVEFQFSEEQKNKIIKLYEDGKTQKEIADEFCVPRRTIMKLCVKLGLKKNHSEAQKSRFDPDFVTKVLLYRSQGKTMLEIVQLTNRSLSAVGRVLKKKGDNQPVPTYDEQVICSGYQSGVTLSELSDKYEISYYILRQLLVKNNVSIKPPIMNGGAKIKLDEIELPEFQDTVEWFDHAYKKYGMSSIAKFLGRSIGYVAGKLRKYEIKLYSISERTIKLDRNAVLTAYNELGSMNKVARRFNCTITAIKDILLDYQVALTTVSEMFSGPGNPFYGKSHPEEIRTKCAEIGAYFGAKFWLENPEYVEVVREKQKLIWSDLEKRKEDSDRVTRLIMEGKVKSKKGIVDTRWGMIPFDSSWESQLIEKLERDERVVLVERNFAAIEYEFDGQLFNFLPDFRIWLRNGEFFVVEVKNNWLLLKQQEQAKISAAFGLLLDKFMITDNDLDEVFNRIQFLMSPLDFSFDELTIEEVKSFDYMRFYKLFHYMGLTGRQGYTLGSFLRGKLIAACTISSITRNEIAERLLLTPSEVRELVRFCIHPDFQKKNFASWFLSRVVREYRNKNQNVRKLISFADTTQGHSGTIYKAAGWSEDGETGPSYHYLDREGFIIHKKTAYDRARGMGFSEAEYARRSGFSRVFEYPKRRFVLNLD